MNREEFIEQLKASPITWDIIVIGGGATGLGIAVDAASRGFSTVLLEQSDFAKATSCRSTKLVHGGVRYLQKGDVGLVIEALHERGYLRKNAPHLVSNQRFLIGSYFWWEKPFYTIGLTLYDLLAGTMGLGHSHPLSKKEAVKRIPQIEQKNLRGGISYHDGQFDDSRLAINLFQTIREKGGTVLNYTPVTGILKEKGRVVGVRMVDAESGMEYEIRARVVMNSAWMSR